MEAASTSPQEEDQTQYTRSAAKGLSPYPGLRPFTEDESSFFFGRQAQVNQIISHLKTTQVVFVLGGSGSGKSSLIRAGVISELRGYAIKDAGDHWVPVVVTPGTNLADAQNPHVPLRTPLHRLASRLANSAFLKSQDDPDNAEEQLRERMQVMETLLRNPGGFRLVYDRFFQRNAPHEVNLSPNLLIVLDQFEEVFHPSNVGVADCQLLVERIMEHFDACHPRVFVVITMRSEHLNDCATFLRLPDIINRTSFLVRRLEPSELQESIVKPGQRKLRILQRTARNKAMTLPSSFAFDLHLLQRILEDVEQIKSDPDHLPLLQHLLARLYESAMVRARKENFDFPAQITLDDLKEAINPGHKPEPHPLQAGNMLRRCLEACAEHAFENLLVEDQIRIERILCHLAFKDPNSGLYTQQRLLLQDAMALVDADSSETVNRLLTPFLSPLDYLYWDTATPGVITIKVSHESFIRGWNRFRSIIDNEHSVFEDYMHLAKDYQLWKDEGYTNYLSQLRIKALERQGITRRIQQEYDRRYLSLLVRIKRERPKYCLDYEGIAAYVSESRQHIADARKRRMRFKTTVVSLSAALGLSLVVGGYYSAFVAPEKERMVDLFETFPLVRVAQRINQSQYIDFDRQQISISNLAAAADTLKSECEIGKKTCVAYRSIGDDALKITTWVESDINNEARALLSKGVLVKPENSPGLSSTPWQADANFSTCRTSNGNTTDGRLLRGEQGRNIFVDTSSWTLLSMHVATINDSVGCIYAGTEPITTLPISNPPRVFFSKDLKNMVVVTQDLRNPEQFNASFNDLNWSFQAGQWTAFSRERMLIADKHTPYMRDADMLYGFFTLDRNETLGSQSFAVGGLSVTSLNAEQPVPEKVRTEGRWSTLEENTRCRSFAKARPDAPVVLAATDGDYCFHIAAPTAAMNGERKQSTGSTTEPAMRNYIVSVYRFSLKTSESPVAIAEFPLRSFDDAAQVKWMIGRQREVSGWITSQRDREWASAAPWRTETLIGLLKPSVSGPAASLALTSSVTGGHLP